MPSNRVDQVSFNGALKNHQRRISILEAVPPSGGTALPPWFDYTPTLGISASGGGGDTEPTVTVGFARLMVQTTDGETVPDGGFPVADGTVLGEAFVTIVTPGTPKSGGTSLGFYIFDLSSEPGTYAPKDPSDGYIIGGGFVYQASTNTYLHADLFSDGTILIPNIPDLFTPAGGLQNCARIGNPYLSPPSSGFPWDWAADDLINLSWQYSMGVD